MFCYFEFYSPVVYFIYCSFDGVGDDDDDDDDDSNM